VPVKNDPYKIVSEIYNHIMKTIGYHEWGKYISSIKEFYAPEAKLILEIAAGTGKLAEYLNAVFPSITLLDISQSMISLADKSFKRVCADMKLLPFKNKYDFIYSTFDSINYLKNKEDLLNYFNEVAFTLTDNGIFTFDASLENNSIKNVTRLSRKGKYKGKLFVQKSTYDFENKIHYNKFKVKFESGEIFEEIHSQKIYDFEIYFELAEKAGLKVLACFDAFTYEDANKDSERIQFIMKRIDA
jgi:ubiquinone/menaquinone biosynthesis C-methylase UbiE